MSKKNTRKPAPMYPPSWYEIRDLDPTGLDPLAKAVVETIRRTMKEES